MIERKLYLDQLKPYLGKPYVKVLTGIRRSGKSSILQMLAEELQQNGVSSDQIIAINFESLAFADIANAKKLREYVLSKLSKKGKTYLLIDEIQEVQQWEKAVSSLMVEADIDITITGSNSKLLSSELATHIAGRYVSIHVQTLSFREYRLFRKCGNGESLTDEFWDYVKRGGFPQIALDQNSYEQDYKTVNDIYASIVLRDIVARRNIRDIELMERVIHFVFDNVGNIFSASKVAEYFKSQRRNVHVETIYNYLAALEEAFIIVKKPRYDLRGKEVLKTNEKYFVGDHALIYSRLGFNLHNLSGILENIVMHELVRRGYDVFIGKIGEKEIDFIGQKRNQKIYVQVAYKLETDNVVQREFTPLLAIKDNYPKYVLSMDEHWNGSYEGVKYMSIPEFLAGDWE
jgi:predicted AAA+ superfamily ATPase